MPFTGHYEHLIDEKNRLSIPSALRNQLDPERQGRCWYMVPGLTHGSLWLYPEKFFSRLSDRIDSDLTLDFDQLALDQALYPLAELLEMDMAGRVVLPAKYLQDAGIGREVTVAGVRDHVEIVNREEFNRRKADAWTRYAEIQRQAHEAALKKRRQPGPSAGNS